MKFLLQSTLLTPEDWAEHDSSGWAALPKKPVPPGVVDDTPGWCHGLNVQGVIFHADHYHIQDITDGVRVTIWNDDPAFNPAKSRYARVWNILFTEADSALGGALNTRQSQVVFAEEDIMPVLSASAPLKNTVFQPWSLFNAPTSEVMHGIGVSDQLHANHLAVRTRHGWREWTEGLDASELDADGHVKTQRPQGRFARATGTRTYFMQAAARASGVHVATDEVAFETTADSSSVTESTPSGPSDELSFLFTTPSGEPNSGAWPTGTYRCSFDAATVGADMEFGLLTLGGSAGHFGRVDTGLTSDLETKTQTQAAITATGITVVDTGSVSWTAGAAADRFECLVAQRNTAAHGGAQTVTLTCDADAFADGPWAAAAGLSIPVAMDSYRKRRVP